MFCPRCRVEYREGFVRCSECDVALVNELPREPEPEYLDLVTVFEGDANAAAVAKAALESAGIQAWIKDEDVQGVFPSLGPIEVQVMVENEEAALEALDLGDEDLIEMDEEEGDDEEETDEEFEAAEAQEDAQIEEDKKREDSV